MDKVTCPTFIVHGQKDKLIPIDHAYKLKDKCSGPTFFLSPSNMTHNDFDFYEDLIRPLMRFLCQINILQSYDDDSDYEREEPPSDTSRILDQSKVSHHKKQSSLGSNVKALLSRSSIFEEPPEEKYHLKFSEEFFIPPKQKQMYFKCQTETATS